MSKFGTSKGTAVSRNAYAHLGFLRRSQLITTFGPGAVVEMPEYTVILSDASRWYPGDKGERFTLHEPNLEKLCGVTSFREPPTQENRGVASRPRDIEAFRFPYFNFCPECGVLKPYWEFRSDPRHLVCQDAHRPARIIPSRFVAACPNGHLEDFPYSWWVHHGKSTNCTQKLPLKIAFSPDRADPGGIRITCTECGATATMANALGQSGLWNYKCRGKRPWLFKGEDEECEARMLGMLRTSTNLYFPETASALTIPPWSTKLQQAIADKREAIELILETPMAEEQKIDFLLKKLNSQAGASFTREELTEALKTRFEKESSDRTASGDLRHDEYLVLSGKSYSSEEDLHFHTEHTDVPASLSDYFASIVLVKRLREVMALRGFRRVGSVAEDEARLQSAAGASFRPDWLPAVEMRGEGVFMTLREDALREWETRAAGRYAELRRRLVNSDVRMMLPNPFSPRLVLLHTLAHLLIRQLASESGYATAAIKERIYACDGAEPMAGILLYTASSDADGSLGGLVRKGKTEAFKRTFFSMLEEAAWCASDPVCSETTAQGYDSLNYAACHSCALLPETCCELRNCLLDRGAVVGAVEDRSLGMFGALIV